MLFEILNLVLGLVAGIVTGFYFERRGNASQRQQHEETLKHNEELRGYIARLEHQLSEHNISFEQKLHEVQETIVVRREPSQQPFLARQPQLDTTMMLHAIRNRIGPDGKIHTASLRSTFIGEGYTPQNIEQVLNDLVVQGRATLEGNKVELL